MKRTTQPAAGGSHIATPFVGNGIYAPCQTLGFAREATLYLYGDRADSLYRLVDGMIRVGRLTPDGNVATVRHVLPGDFFGEEALIVAPRGATAEALTDATVVAFDPSYIDEPDLRVVMGSLSRQLQNLMDYGYHLQSGGLRQRVARYLTWLAGTPLGGRDDDGRIAIGVTHEMLAEGTGSTRESVSKIITELRSEGWIESGYRSIIVLDEGSLGLIGEGFV